jgi:hypothetical protein
MREPPILLHFVVGLIAMAVVLPITICVVVGVAALLTAMGDSCGGVVLGRIGLACGVLWVIDLICLTLLVAIGAVLAPTNRKPGGREPDEREP